MDEKKNKTRKERGRGGRERERGMKLNKYHRTTLRKAENKIIIINKSESN